MLLAALAVAVLLLLAANDASARSRHTVEHNADVSTTARTGVVRAAPGGGGVLRGRTVVGPNGATAVRQGQSARNADGTASHSSAMAAQGDRGTLQSTGAATRSADGSVTQGRTTTATSASTGNSVQTSSSYNTDTGRTRSASCFDASGAPMACPARP
jgi:hypothetical protein